MQLVAKSDLSTGNKSYASYALKSNDLMFVFSAPYQSPSDPEVQRELRAHQPHPGHVGRDMRDFCDAHGFAVRAVGVLVDDAEVAYDRSVANGARGVLPPHRLTDDASEGLAAHVVSGAETKETASTASAVGASDVGYYQKISEVELYGDVVLRYVSNHQGSSEPSGPSRPLAAEVEADGNGRPSSGTVSEKVYLPRYEDVPLDLDGGLDGIDESNRVPLTYGLQRLDHAVGNVRNLIQAVDYITGFTGMHEFAEFTAEDVGTVDSGLNSMVLANDNEMILLPVNEPTFGTKRKSQIQTFLEQNNGPGLQHLALKTDDIFRTVRAMRVHGGGRGGFEFQKPASEDYYRKLPDRVGADALTPEQFAEVRELGLLVDRDDQGVLVQIFTKPLGDRPTVFIEIIQRIGCMREVKPEVEDTVRAENGAEAEAGAGGNEMKVKMEQAAGCGGFGKGNFSELFKSIENYEKTLKV